VTWPFAQQESPWTDTLIEKLKEDWDAGYSTAVIGKRLGVSKNAVIGKAHRLYLAPREQLIKRKIEA